MSASPSSSAATISRVWLVASEQWLKGKARHHWVIAAGTTPAASVGVATSRTCSDSPLRRLAASRRMPTRSRFSLSISTKSRCASGRRVELAAHAVEQRHSELQLAVLQHLGDGRLGDVQQLRGAADRAGLHDRVEDFDVA